MFAKIDFLQSGILGFEIQLCAQGICNHLTTRLFALLSTSVEEGLCKRRGYAGKKMRGNIFLELNFTSKIFLNHLSPLMTYPEVKQKILFLGFLLFDAPCIHSTDGASQKLSESTTLKASATIFSSETSEANRKASIVSLVETVNLPSLPHPYIFPLLSFLEVSFPIVDARLLLSIFAYTTFQEPMV